MNEWCAYNSMKEVAHTSEVMPSHSLKKYAITKLILLAQLPLGTSVL